MPISTRTNPQRLYELSVIGSGALDYAADSRGQTFGAAAKWTRGTWTLRGGVFQLSATPNGKVTGFHPQLHLLVAESEHRHAHLVVLGFDRTHWGAKVLALHWAKLAARPLAKVLLHATWLFTRVDVRTNCAVFASGLAVWLAGLLAIDLVLSLAIDVYIVKDRSRC